ncbi:MAG: protein O-mannosyl-transferase family [Gemmatimonadaceae bacterium]
MAGATLLVIYSATLAPGVTFWDAGELIAASHALGIPHPPGTPLYVALAHVWASALGGTIGFARATNLLSAASTALAGAATAWLVARSLGTRDGGWIGVLAALSAGTMLSAWSNATETEVYAVALLHAVVMLVAAAMAGEGTAPRHERWTLLTVYLMALTPALHLSALVAAPAAIVLAARGAGAAARQANWLLDRTLTLTGAAIASAGVGRMEWTLIVAGIALAAVGALVCDGPRGIGRVARLTAIIGVAATALLVMLVRARFDPTINQGNPATIAALADVVARRQYAVAPLFPRSAPIWLQAANVFQYVDWQAAMSWGAGIMTSPLRVLATLAWLGAGAIGWRAMRRDARTLALALATLALAGTFGVAVYLNLKAGASLGWGILPDDAPHEARERDYFFVLGFWAWGCLAGAGAVALARRLRAPIPAALVALALPLAGNWSSADRSREPEAGAARELAHALLDASPRGSVLLLDGDNDSYPIWYLQEVEAVRRDVLPVTVPLLPADWYPAEIARRSGLRWSEDPVTGARTLSEQRAAQIAAAAHEAGRPVAASPALGARERALLGTGWVLRGPVYVAEGAGRDARLRASIDSVAAARWLAGRQPWPRERRSRSGDDVARVMMSLLDCPRLADGASASSEPRDSLEVRCNLR